MNIQCIHVVWYDEIRNGKLINQKNAGASKASKVLKVDERRCLLDVFECLYLLFSLYFPLDGVMLDYFMFCYYYIGAVMRVVGQFRFNDDDGGGGSGKGNKNGVASIDVVCNLLHLTFYSCHWPCRSRCVSAL